MPDSGDLPAYSCLREAFLSVLSTSVNTLFYAQVCGSLPMEFGELHAELEEACDTSDNKLLLNF